MATKRKAAVKPAARKPAARKPARGAPAEVTRATGGKSMRARGAQKAFWGGALDRLKAMLEKAA